MGVRAWGVETRATACVAIANGIGKCSNRGGDLRAWMRVGRAEEVTRARTVPPILKKYSRFRARLLTRIAPLAR